MNPPDRFEAGYDDALASAAAWTFAKRRLAWSRRMWVGVAALVVIEAACALCLARL